MVDEGDMSGVKRLLNTPGLSINGANKVCVCVCVCVYVCVCVGGGEHVWHVLLLRAC